MNQRNEIPIGSIVEIKTTNGGRIGGALYGHAFGPSRFRAYTRQLGECGSTRIAGVVTIDTGTQLVTVEGSRISSFQSTTPSCE